MDTDHQHCRVSTLFFTMEIIFVVLSLLSASSGQTWEAVEPETYASGLRSPCPTVFTYDSGEPARKPGKWFGSVRLTTTVKLVGFTLDVKLDRSADLLGNWQGEVETEDNTRFSITSLTKKINPGAVFNMRLFVKYNPEMPAPKIMSIKLNGRKICPAPAATTVRPAKPTTVRPPARPTRPTATGSVGVRPVAPTTRRPTVTSKPAGGGVTPAPVHAPAANADVKCGTVRTQPQALITHGQGTERGQWPWHVAMYQNKGKDLTYICGGSLIGRKAVVTAAHCVTRRPTDRVVDADTLVLYFGKYHLLLWSDGGVQNKQIQQVNVHPSYNSTNFKGDIAVLTLKSPVEYSEFVRPICLWNPSKTNLNEVVNKEGTVVGWGFDETGTVSQELMMAKMPVVDQQTCIWSYPEFFSVFTNNMTFCAGFKNGTSVCNGDSGGGMVFPIKQKDNTNMWFLRGLVSLSPSKADERVCDTSHYVVFTDVAKYLSWLTPFINLK